MTAPDCYFRTGPAAVVTAQTAPLVAQLTTMYGGRATCRTITHHASHTGEIRVYITVTRKASDDNNNRA